MVRSKDIFTLDLFSVPAPAPSDPGSVHCAREIAAAMSQAVKDSPHDRIEIAARMSRLLGEEITLAMLNSWTAESRDQHIPNFERAIAFDVATEVCALAKFHAAKCGGQFLLGKDALLAELGRLDQARSDIDRQQKALKQYLGRQR